MFKNQLVASLVKTEDVLSFVKILKNICLNIKSIDAAKEFVGEMTLDALNQLKTKSSHTIPLLLESLLHHNLGISEKFTEIIQSKLEHKVDENISNLDGFDIPNGSKAQLIELYCNSNELDKALNLYEKENETKEFRLDQLKTIKLVDLVLKSGDTEKAINILIENRGKTINEEESYLYKNNIWKLLNNLSETGNVEVLNKLSCRFIQNEDAESLQKLTDLSTTIHGEVNSLYDLVFSFIECGRIRQARQILETPGLKNRSNRISNACERYKNDGNIKSLEAMIEATRDINYIDRNFIYFNLLQSYEKENDHQKALNLWTRMQEENIVPSDTFLIKLGKLLKENNINVPFTIPSSSKKSENIEKSTKLKIVNDPKLKTIDLYNKFEGLLKENKISEASIMFNNFINKTNNIPRRLLKFYINKLASIGDYESIEKMVLSDEIKKKISFDNRLCHAYIKADKVNDYFIKLREDLENCKSIGEIQDKGAAFPRGGALGILENFPDMYEECK
uniref:Pentacotripeptide-repeat region of PRORP domain-containing protein n=1 Tax=Megaselia scalaris TaxID=36166 RepID=T1GRJ9_MEGSC